MALTVCLSQEMEESLLLAAAELVVATQKNGAFNSAHEGWAVIKEELDELWEEVRKKSQDRNSRNMAKEAIQVAAMGLRFYMDIVIGGKV